jgi:calcium-dependent protein kinase
MPPFQFVRFEKNTYHFNNNFVDCGRYGTVYKSLDLSGRTVAVKVLPKMRHDVDELVNIRLIRNEIKSLEKLRGCKNVVQMHDAFQDDEYVYIVEDYCRNGTLDTIVKVRKKQMTEYELCNITKRILSGLNECHRNGVYHGDIKPSNIMMSRFADITLVDFGHSEETFSPLSGCFEKRGTPWYTAPEIFEGHYGFSPDMWALGIIMYVMMYKRHPYYENGSHQSSTSTMHNVLTNKKLEFPSNSIFSDDAKNFVRQALDIDPAKRISANDGLKHAFIQDSWTRLSINQFNWSAEV